jgi:hypothetical protein|nr:MAG TPA: hypothetical protein [Caudoviricetes sp.]
MDDLQQLLDERLEAQTTPLNKVHSSTIHRKEITVDLDNEKIGVRNESAMGKDLSVKIDKQQADKNCDLDDLFAMINKLVVKALKKDNVEFNPDEGARFVVDQQVPINHPIIQFDVISYEPKLELKPRVINQFIEESDDKNDRWKRHGQVWSQRFKCVIQFNIIGSDYITANKVMRDFEELMFRYAGYFKQQGVAEIVFKSRFSDKNYDYYRQNLSVRSLQYYVEIERNYVSYDTDISGVLI